MITTETLKTLFEENPGKDTLHLEGRCVVCECGLTVEICATTEGFGINGGILLDRDQQNIVICCVDCIHAAPARLQEQFTVPMHLND